MQWNQQIANRSRKATVGGWVAGLTALGLLAVLAGSKEAKPPVTARATAKQPQPAAIRSATDTFPLEDRPIRVERFEPAAPGKCPAIILVHAVDGVEAYGPIYRLQAGKYAGEGYVVLLVHYFDRMGGGKEKLKPIKESFRHFFDPKAVPNPQNLRAMRQHFSTWVETVRASVRYAATLPNVDSRRVGLAGFSLGAALALAAAGAEDPDDRKIATVVSLFGCLPPDLREGIRGLPPTLMIQGDVDERIPPLAAYDFETWLSRRQLPVEFKMYPRMGHVFEGARRGDFLAAQSHIKQFLRTQLKPRDPGPSQRDASAAR